jgi:hypothetical protein
MNSLKSKMLMGSMLLLTAGILAGMARVNAQEKQSPAGSKYQYKVGVLPFLDNTGSQGQDIGPALGRAVQAELVHSSDLVGRVVKLDEGTHPEDVDGEKAVEIGKAQKVDTILVGTILEANSEESEKGAHGPTVFGQSVGGSARSVKATVTLQGDLYDVTTGKIIESIRVTGKASETKVGADVSSTLGDLSSGGESFQNSPIGKALHNAVANLVKRIAANESKMTRFQGQGNAKPPGTN